MSEVTIAVEQRNEFGKGAARRTRRAGQIPAVLYGHGSDPKHLSLPSVEFARAIRENGNNAVLTLEVAGSDKELALTKTITAHPIKGYIEHVDLLLVKRGEKVVVNVPVVVNGDQIKDAAAGYRCEEGRAGNRSSRSSRSDLHLVLAQEGRDHRGRHLQARRLGRRPRRSPHRGSPGLRRRRS